MFDSFLILTPILLLGIVALFAFVGCNLVFGLGETILAIEVNQIIPSQGPAFGGTAVQILGTNFTGVDKVTFGGLDAASFTVKSDTEIDAVTPRVSGPQSAQVVVTRSTGSDAGSSSNNVFFEYLALGFVQTASAAQAGNPPISVALNNTSQGNVLIAAVSYGGPAAGSVSVSDSLGNAFTLAGSGPWFRQSRIFYLPDIPGGNLTITATGAGGATGPCSICVSEYSGADPSSAAIYGFSTKASPGTGTAGIEPIQGVAVALASSSDFAFVVVFAAQPTQITSGAGFTLRPSTTASLLVEDSATSIAGTQTVATIDSTGGGFVPWVALAVGIKA
jgi:IPT/TIG domain